MLSEKLHEAFNAQINAELWSAYLYLSMSMDAESKGLKGVANWFRIQFQEEQDHARILMNYVLSRDARVELRPIEAVKTVWDSPLAMFQDTLEHEKKVTAMINNLAAIATADNDYASANMLVWFVNEQVEEEENARDMIARSTPSKATSSACTCSTRSWPHAPTACPRRLPPKPTDPVAATDTPLQRRGVPPSRRHSPSQYIPVTCLWVMS